MTGAGYSYTTLSADRGEPTRVAVSLYLDGQSWMCVAGAEDDRPRLTVAHGDVSVSIGPPPGPVARRDAQIARRLADLAAEYAAAVERLSAASTAAPEGGAADGEAAGDPAA
jgi:hypothetical protein